MYVYIYISIYIYVYKPSILFGCSEMLHVDFATNHWGILDTLSCLASNCLAPVLIITLVTQLEATENAILPLSALRGLATLLYTLT